MPIARKKSRTTAAKKATATPKNNPKRTAARKTAAKKTAAAKRHGDVLGVSGGQVPKRPVKSSGRKRRPAGIELETQRSRNLPRARVRG